MLPGTSDFCSRVRLIGPVFICGAGAAACCACSDGATRHSIAIAAMASDTLFQHEFLPRFCYRRHLAKSPRGG
jgi:hypothetical protein